MAYYYLQYDHETPNSSLSVTGVLKLFGPLTIGLTLKKRHVIGVLFGITISCLECRGISDIVKIVPMINTFSSMNTQSIHDLTLEDARSAVASIERLDYENAYRNAKAVCENLLLLIEEEMYRGNNND